MSVANSNPGNVANITEVNITVHENFNVSLETNGTDSFSRLVVDGYTLSWQNFTDYVVNGSETNYFWFNATAVVPGDYNFTLLTTNGTITEMSNLSVSVNDTTAPVIDLVSPVNGSSSTARSYNFTFNVTDPTNVSYCNLTVDNNFMQMVSWLGNGLNGMYNGTFGAGAHNWTVYCEDGLGYSRTSEMWFFTVVEEEEEEEEEEHAWSGSRKYFPNYHPSDKELSEGYRIRLREEYQVSFDVGEENHQVKVKKIGDGGVEIEISSDLVTAKLSVGEEKMFELTGDKYYDLRVGLEEISGYYAYFVITTVYEPVLARGGVEEEEDVVESGGVGENRDSVPANSPSVAEENSSNLALVVVAVFMAVAGGVGVYLLWRNRKVQKRSSA